MKILGMMSGSSLDGIDLALCSFKNRGNKTEWSILKSATITYSTEWKDKLKRLTDSTALEFAQADYDLGKLFGEVARGFLAGEKIDFIASHGHTLFHYPEKSMTYQLGNGAMIAATSGISTISDFRSTDIGLGGQGAPFASIVDRDLLTEYDAMINLGGISNVSINGREVTAFDIGPCNQLLNYLANKIGKEYDDEGKMASQGTVNQELLEELLEDEYFDRRPPKSLDNTYVMSRFTPILDKFSITIEDKLATCVEFISMTISDQLNFFLNLEKDTLSVIITGGGAKNSYLIRRIEANCNNCKITIPDHIFVEYKEALLMAYMGFLRVNEKENVLSSVTGAACNSVSGAVYFV